MKEKLTLSVDRSAKIRAKKISERSGISVSRLFETFINNQADPNYPEPEKGSAVAEMLKIVPESRKVKDYNYKKLKQNALKAKFG